MSNRAFDATLDQQLFIGMQFALEVQRGPEHGYALGRVVIRIGHSGRSSRVSEMPAAGQAASDDRGCRRRLRAYPPAANLMRTDVTHLPHLREESDDP